MAIRPEISLGVKTPEVQGPLQTYKDTMSLRLLLDQQAMAQQQMNMNQQRLQFEAERSRGEKIQNDDLERTVAGKKAFSDALASAVKLGPDGSFGIDDTIMVSKLKDHAEQLLTYQKYKDDITKEARENLKSELETRSKVNKAAAAYFAPLLDASPELQPDLYSATVKRAKADKTVASAVKDLPDTFEPDVMPYIQSMVQSTVDDPFKAHLDLMKRKEEADLAAAKLPGEKADADQKQRKSEAAMLGAAKNQEAWNAAMTSIPIERRKLYPATWSEDARKEAVMSGVDANTRATLEKTDSRVELAAAAAKGDKDAKAALEFLDKAEIELDYAKEKNKVKAQMDMFGATGTGGQAIPTSQLAPGQKNEAYLSTLPDAIRGQVKALAEGRMAFPSGFAMRSPYWINLLQAVAEYDPTFDAINFNTRAKLRATYTSGPVRNNLNAINTALEHVGRTYGNIDKLGNFQVPIVNKVLNMGARALGMDANLNKFNEDVQALVSESTRAWRGTGGNEADLVQWRKGFDEAASPSALKASLQELAELLLGRVRPLHDAYLDGMNLKNSDIDIVKPRAAETLKTLGVEGYDEFLGTAPAKSDTPAPAGGAPKAGTKKLSEDIIQRVMAGNKGATREQVIEGLKQLGYQ